MVKKKSSINISNSNTKYSNRFFSTNNALTSADSVIDTKDHMQTKAFNVEDKDNNVQDFIVDTHSMVPQYLKQRSLKLNRMKDN